MRLIAALTGAAFDDDAAALFFLNMIKRARAGAEAGAGCSGPRLPLTLSPPLRRRRRRRCRCRRQVELRFVESSQSLAGSIIS